VGLRALASSSGIRPGKNCTDFSKRKTLPVREDCVEEGGEGFHCKGNALMGRATDGRHEHELEQNRVEGGNSGKGGSIR